MKMLCIGDSNTFGFDPHSYLGDRYPEEVRWTGRLSSVNVINWGINGITIPQDCSVYVELIKRKDPDLVTVMLGTNDILEGASSEQAAHRMGAFLDAISVTGAKILLIAPPQLQHGEFVLNDGMIEESRRLGGLYQELASEKGCLFADAGEWNVDISFDGVHFSEEGHAAFAQGLEEKLKQLI